jgi:hypothetical protein
MSASYEPDVILVLPKIGRFVLDSRVADHIVRLNAELTASRAWVRKADAVVKAARKARDARWVQPIDYDKRTDYNADMALGEALAAFEEAGCS